jgi:hypothetical protein
MKWIKHDTDANQDAKLQNVLLDYGLEGYGLYWYCIELIAGKVDPDNITFELEHDARIIARNVGSTPQKVEEMMRYFVKTGLFEDSDGVITCLKIGRRLDQSMTSNKQMREIISSFKMALKENVNHDSIMIKSDKVMQEERRSEESTLEDINNLVQPTAKPKKYKFDSYHMGFAEWMYSQLLLLNPNFKKPNLDSWASTLRLMFEVDNRDSAQAGEVFAWANKDDFWSSNILSPESLRKQYDKLVVKMKHGGSSGGTKKINVHDLSEKVYYEGKL